jgi:hypothetical protein
MSALEIMYRSQDQFGPAQLVLTGIVVNTFAKHCHFCMYGRAFWQKDPDEGEVQQYSPY